jgi:hypothetical protein
VKVGAHVAPPAEELPSWMARFDECTPEGIVTVTKYGRIPEGRRD